MAISFRMRQNSEIFLRMAAKRKKMRRFLETGVDAIPANEYWTAV